MNKTVDKINYCTNCKYFLRTSKQLTACECAKKVGYITKNALRKCYCSDYEAKEEFNLNHHYHNCGSG